MGGHFERMSDSIRSSLFTLTFINVIVVCYASIACPPLYVLPGTVLKCELRATNQTINCFNGTDDIPKGTLGRYRCERDQDFSGGVLKCGCKGRWRGIQAFNDFMSNCNISDYSNSGPSELNLTETEIQQLALPAPEQLSTKDFQEDGVAFHNVYRSIHHAPPLELNMTLSDAAQKWADRQADESVLKTQDWSERRYSQNLYRVTGNGIDAREAVKLAVAAWYQGAYHYNWENPTGPQSAFTQIVWKSTTDVGIGVAQRGNQTTVVANYYPPGNIIVSNKIDADKWAWFRINVFPPNLVNETSQVQSMTATASSIAPSTVAATTVITTTTERGSASVMTTTTTEATTTTN